VWWIITRSNAFDLSIDPGAVTRTVVCTSDQPPEAHGVGCAGDIPVILEALSQLVGQGVGDRSADILARLLVGIRVRSHVLHERSVGRTRRAVTAAHEAPSACTLDPSHLWWVSTGPVRASVMSWWSSGSSVSRLAIRFHQRCGRKNHRVNCSLTHPCGLLTWCKTIVFRQSGGKWGSFTSPPEGARRSPRREYGHKTYTRLTDRISIDVSTGFRRESPHVPCKYS
jgi:hypothetical protein